MREIKFRAWDKKNNFMIMQDDKQLKSLDLSSGYIYVGYYKGENDRFIRFAEIELMQYTGLKDVNGREIFEGDVIKFTNGIDEVYEEIGTVVFDLDECGYKVQYSKDSAVHCIYLINAEKFSDRFYQITYEVIGNIYENPELLD